MKNIFNILLLLLFFNCTIAQIPNYVPVNGLMGYWPFSNNANDVSGNNNNGIVSGASLTVDRFLNSNSAYSFNGTNSYISTNYTGVLGGNPRAVSFWAKTSATNYMSAVGWGDNQFFPNAGTRYACAFNVGNPGISIDVADAAITYTGSGNHADNNWHHYVVQFNGGALNQVQIYMDAILLTTTSYTYRPNTILNTINNFNVQFGRIIYPANYGYFNGSIDDIGIWNRMLNMCEIKQLYNSAITQINITTSNSLICAGQSATLTATGVNTYTWNTGSNNTSITVSPTTSATYSVVGTSTLTTCSPSAAIAVSVSACAGIKGFNTNNEIILAPNPNKGEFLVSGLERGTTIEVYNTLGSLVYSSTSESDKEKINLTVQNPGLYIVKFISGEKTFIRKVIKE